MDNTQILYILDMLPKIYEKTHQGKKAPESKNFDKIIMLLKCCSNKE